MARLPRKDYGGSATGPGGPGYAHASTGIYVFTATALVEAVSRDAADPSSAHDVGGSLIPRLVRRGEAAVYDLERNDVPGAISTRVA